jgi:predicted DNA-binding transcriptional regulator YafY
MKADGSLARTRRLLLVIAAAAKATQRGRGLPLAEAARLCGARSTQQVLDDLESLKDLSLAPTYAEYELLVEVEDDRIWIDRAMQLHEVPAFSLREGAALRAALRPFEKDGGPAVASASRKLRGVVPAFLRAHADELARATDFRIEGPGEWADALEEAIARRVEVTVEYRAGATADASRKTLEPRLLFPQDGHWYLAAWNVEKREEHLYRLDRIVSVVLGTRLFGEHQGPSPDRYAKGGRLYFQSGTEREVMVLFRRVAAKLATERWPVQVEARADGSVVVTARLTPGPYLYGWVLGFGADAEIVGPEDVRRAYLGHVETLRARYAAPEPVGS